MSRNRKILIAVGALVATFVSCQKDLDVNLPAQSSRLVINSVNVLGDRVRAKLSYTVPILEYKDQKELNIPDALIVLYDNNEPADTLIYYKDEMEYASELSTRPGHIYKLQAIVPGYPVAEASANVPSQVPFNIVHAQHVTTNRFNEPMDRLSATFKDRASLVTDYYRIRIIKVGANYQYYTGDCIESTDPSVENLLDETIGEVPCYSGEGIYMRDALFNGVEKNVQLFVAHDELKPVVDSNGYSSYVMVLLDHISEPYHKYLKTTAYLIHNDSNPFAEPSNAFTNVTNGYGIFTILARSQRNLK